MIEFEIKGKDPHEEIWLRGTDKEIKEAIKKLEEDDDLYGEEEVGKD